MARKAQYQIMARWNRKIINPIIPVRVSEFPRIGFRRRILFKSKKNISTANKKIARMVWMLLLNVKDFFALSEEISSLSNFVLMVVKWNLLKYQKTESSKNIDTKSSVGEKMGFAVCGAEAKRIMAAIKYKRFA
jgi:hypothetical protein